MSIIPCLYKSSRTAFLSAFASFHCWKGALACTFLRQVKGNISGEKKEKHFKKIYLRGFELHIFMLSIFMFLILCLFLCLTTSLKQLVTVCSQTFPFTQVTMQKLLWMIQKDRVFQTKFGNVSVQRTGTKVCLQHALDQEESMSAAGACCNPGSQP